MAGHYQTQRSLTPWSICNLDCIDPLVLRCGEAFNATGNCLNRTPGTCVNGGSTARELVTLRIRPGTQREWGSFGGSTGYPVCVPSDGCACRVSLASGPG